MQAVACEPRLTKLERESEDFLKELAALWGTFPSLPPSLPLRHPVSLPMPSHQSGHSAFPPSFPPCPGTLDKQALHQSAKFSVGFSTPYGGGAEGGRERGAASGGVPDATAAFGVERVKELLAKGGVGEGGEEVATMRRKYDDLVSYTSTCLGAAPPLPPSLPPSLPE